LRKEQKRKSNLCRIILAAIPALVITGFANPTLTQQELPAMNYIGLPLPTTAADNSPAEEIVIEEITPVIEAAEEITPVLELEEAAAEPDFEPYDIPLSEDLQRYTYDLCAERGLEFETVLGLMAVESDYRPNLISATNDYGIMQINACNQNWLITELGVTDFLDARQNINAGTFMLMNISKKYSDTHRKLMVYNFGEAGAKKVWNKGVFSSEYSRKVTAKAGELERK
jgi:soluble lytic murein transglycosylase-like protein